MSADSAHGAPYVYEGVEFPRVKVKGYAVLEAYLRDKRRASAKAIANDCGLAGDAKAKSIREAEREVVSMYDVDDFTHSEEGFRLALRESLKLGGKDQASADQVIDGLDPNDARMIARIVLGFVELVPAKGGTTSPKGGETASATGPSSTPPSDSTSTVTPQS